MSKMYGNMPDEELNKWERLPRVINVLTCRQFGAWLLRRDENIKEQKVGKWIPMGLVDANDNRNYECSECHHGDTHAKNQIVPYCWFCGAKMEEGE